MRDLSFVDRVRAIFPENSLEYKGLVLREREDQKYILCYNNMSSSKIPKVKPLDKVIEKHFVLPFIDIMEKEEYEKYLDLLKSKHFHKPVSIINGIFAVNKNIAEFSPFMSQICAGAMLTDKKGRVLVLVETLEDGAEIFHIPQTHIEYTVDIYNKSFDDIICENANKVLNDSVSIVRIEGELEPINLMSGYILNISQTLATSMHTLFATVYQVDDFEKYHIRCRNEGEKAMILDLHEAIDAARTHMMDPWLTYVYTNMIG